MRRFRDFDVPADEPDSRYWQDVFSDVRVSDEDLERLHPSPRQQWPEVLARLNAAGYDGDFQLLGAGATALVLLEPSTGRVFKVSRHPERHAFDMLADEYDFLKSLEGTPAAKHLPRAIDFDAIAGVLVREGVEGEPGRWGTRGLRDVFERIQEAARARNWSAPEYKEDSFIVTDDGRIVMVDVGFANRLGERLAAYVEEALDSGEPLTKQKARDWAFELRMDALDGRLDKARAAALQRRMESIVGESLG